MRRALMLFVCCCLCAFDQTAAQDKTPTESEKETQTPTTATAATAGNSREEPSDAERLTRLRRALEENEKLLRQHEAEKDKLSDEVTKAEGEVRTLDADLEAKKKKLAELQEAGQTEPAAKLQAEIEALSKRRELTFERLDLTIQERRTLLEEINTLEKRIAEDKAAVERLLAPPATQPTAPAPSAATTPAQPPTEGAGKPQDQQPVQPEAAAPAAVPPQAGGGGQTAQPPTDAPAANEISKPPSKELVEAQKEARAKLTDAQAVEERLQEIQARIAGLEKQIEQQRSTYQTARRKIENARETERMLTEQYQKRSAAEDVTAGELRDLWSRIIETRKGMREDQGKVDAAQERIIQLQDELKQSQREEFGALQALEEAQEKAEAAQKKVEQLKNPFSPRNLLQWALNHGPKIIGILVGMFALLWLARVAEGRIIKLMVARGGPGTLEERENRAKTIVSVFHHAATLVVIIGGVFMIVSECGINITPLLGGAAVIGLAVAFGAQNLVRDYFSGLMILLESQYGINDVIKVGEIGGLVERITLRVTVLRGLDGTVHFIPNGQIEKVSNMTHGWSRALFDIGVAYKEDVDRVMELLVQLGKELRADPKFSRLILDNPEMLGVDSFGDSAVVIKFFIKTRPLQQWAVKRELLRRIKKKFDELGIEIPFPHRTVFHRYEGGEPPAGALPADTDITGGSDPGG